MTFMRNLVCRSMTPRLISADPNDLMGIFGLIRRNVLVPSIVIIEFKTSCLIRKTEAPVSIRNGKALCAFVEWKIRKRCSLDRAIVISFWNEWIIWDLMIGSYIWIRVNSLRQFWLMDFPSFWKDQGREKLCKDKTSVIKWFVVRYGRGIVRWWILRPDRLGR